MQKIQADIKILPESEVEIVGEITSGDFEIYRERAVKDISSEVKIDGFRQGNIPEKILIGKIGEQAVLERMAEIALQKAYGNIIEEYKIQAIGRPEITITKLAKNNPLVFKIKTAVMPEVEMPDYKEIAKENASDKDEIIVEEKEIDEAVERVRKIKATKNEKNEEVLPEINDELIKTMGDFKDLNDFRQEIKEGLKSDKEAKAREKKRMDILEKIAEKTKTNIHKIIIEAEKNKMLEETKHSISNMGLKWEDYLSHLKKTEKEIMDGWNEDAIKRIKFNLILVKIAETENINPDNDELEKETEKVAEFYEKTGQKIDRNRVKSYTYNVLRNEKIFKLLESC